MYLQINQIRRYNGQYLVINAGGTGISAGILEKDQSLVSMLAGKNPSRPISNDMARYFDEKFGKQKGWMDHLHSEVHARLSALKSNKTYQDVDNNLAYYHTLDDVCFVPIIEWSTIKDWVNKPSFRDQYMKAKDLQYATSLLTLSSSAYALKVSGDFMMSSGPRSYPAGTLIIVDPDKTPLAQCRLILQEPGQSLPVLRDLTKEGSSCYSKPLNPIYQKVTELDADFLSYGRVVSATNDEPVG